MHKHKISHRRHHSDPHYTSDCSPSPSGMDTMATEKCKAVHHHHHHHHHAKKHDLNSHLRDEKWNKMYRHLRRFKRAYGDCLVPQQFDDDPKLGRWVNDQRNRRDSINPAQRDRLDKLGFVWNVNEASWETMFQSLVDYRNVFGNCHVPRSLNHNHDLFKLANWIHKQRKLKNQGKLPKAKIERLESLSFTWSVNQAHWDEKFICLQRYKEEHGDTLVPARWKEDPQLGTWVVTQRSRKDTLSDERIKRLDDIGFAWHANTKNSVNTRAA